MAITLDAAAFATMTDSELARTLRMDVGEGGGLVELADTIAHNPHSTIEPARRASSDALGRRALAGLGDQRAERGITAGLAMERTIGEGGMGIVRLATQRSLGRKVAVKTLRPGAHDDAATLRLLREAWVTGTLEHPNIVPVYDLGLDEEGSPIIVLKRIEGVEWGAIMRDPEAARERFGSTDLLESNLRILVQLSNAVSLAHARGVLHRDLKPENVMIGSFGEVYLVDWGIAVSLRADPSGRLPLATEQNEMAGTPCYMAPEMLGALGQLSERTDVYLLGAILHEILTGEPPHGGTFKQIMGSILLSSFTYGADVPSELAEMARRAMSRQPEERFASVEAMRLRLEWYLRHRGSLAISAEASRRLEDLTALVATGAPAESLQPKLYPLFAECRFGFRQALKESVDNETARLGLRRAIETIVRFELDRGAPDAAAGALAELEAPPPELRERVAGALRAREAEKHKMAQLERLDAQLDPTVGRRTRLAATMILGVLWTIFPQLTGWAEARRPDHPHWAQYAVTVTILFLAMLVVLWGRESLSKTAVNRRMVAAGIIAFASQLALEVGGHLLGLTPSMIVTLHLLLWATVMACFAAMVDRRFWAASGFFYLSFLVAAAMPARRWDMMSASTFVMLLSFAIAWWRPSEDMPGLHALRARLAREEAERRARRERPPTSLR